MDEFMSWKKKILRMLSLQSMHLPLLPILFAALIFLGMALNEPYDIMRIRIT